MMIVGEAWGADEDAARRPFVGATGRELNRLCEIAEILPGGAAEEINRHLYRGDYSRRDAAYAAAGVHLTNVFNLRPADNRIENLCGKERGTLPPLRPGKHLLPEYYDEIERLKSEIADHKPNIIVGLGATAMWFALGHGYISKQRGTVAPSPFGKFLGTYHPAFLFRGAWNLRPVVIFDLVKAKREAGTPGIQRPARTIYLAESLEDIARTIPRLNEAKKISIDIETSGRQITVISFAWTSEHTLTIPIYDTRRPDNSYWSSADEPQVWRYIRQICALPVPKLFQNGLYDIRFLWENYGIPMAACSDDLMLLHHALQPEVKKGLGFLGSLYTNEPAWKLMRPRGKGTIKQEDME